MEELIRDDDDDDDDKSDCEILSCLVEEYKNVLQYQYSLYKEAVNNNYHPLYLNMSAFHLIERESPNLANQVNLALSVFASKVNTEFDHLENIPDSQIRSDYNLA
jgi:hypothetical protein